MKIFGQTKQLELQVDEILDILSESGLIFGEAVKSYFADGISDRFTEKLERVAALESRGDELRRAIEMAMYTETLMPDLRGDVLTLLENLDDVNNKYQQVLSYFAIETPEIPMELRKDYQELTGETTQSVEYLVLAARAFFRDITTINDHLHKVRFYESEADKTEVRLKQQIFSLDLDLPQKIHLRFFVERLAWISDLAEDIADELAIYAIKRSD